MLRLAASWPKLKNLPDIAKAESALPARNEIAGLPEWLRTGRNVADCKDGDVLADHAEAKRRETKSISTDLPPKLPKPLFIVAGGSG